MITLKFSIRMHTFVVIETKLIICAEVVLITLKNLRGVNIIDMYPSIMECIELSATCNTLIRLCL